MQIFEEMNKYGHEQIVFARDEKVGLNAIIAIHSTVLGPALGGTRFYDYKTEDEALFDVLRLSRGMTLKNAAAGLPPFPAPMLYIVNPAPSKNPLNGLVPPSLP